MELFPTINLKYIRAIVEDVCWLGKGNESEILFFYFFLLANSNNKVRAYTVTTK